MNIRALLEQSAWRIRAYLGAPSTDTRLVGWRHDPCCCPVAEWLFFEEGEQGRQDLLPGEEIAVDREMIVWRSQIMATPPVVAQFIDLIDVCPIAPFRDGIGARVARPEAVAALHQAEHMMAQRLLPVCAESVQRCGYREFSNAETCGAPAITPVIYGFLDTNPFIQNKPQRASCRLFLGSLCEEHWRRAVIVPRSWWPEEFGASLAERLDALVEIVEARR